MAWWRRVLHVGRLDPEGSRRLIEAASRLGARTMKLYGLPDSVCDQMSERSRKLNLIRFARANPAIPPWTKAELRLLDQEDDDAEVSEAIGRSVDAVRIMRRRAATGQRRSP